MPALCTNSKIESITTGGRAVCRATSGKLHDRLLRCFQSWNWYTMLAYLACATSRKCLILLDFSGKSLLPLGFTIHPFIGAGLNADYCNAARGNMAGGASSTRSSPHASYRLSLPKTRFEHIDGVGHPQHIITDFAPTLARMRELWLVEVWRDGWLWGHQIF